MGLEMLAVPLAVALLGYGTATLVVHAIACLTLHVSTSFKRYTAKQMLIALLVMAVNSVSTGAKVALRTVSGLLRWWLFFTTIFILFSGLFVTFTEYPQVWLGAVRIYNQNMGPYVHFVVVIPLQIVDVLLRGLIPIWNSWVWFGKTLGVQGLLPVLLKEVELVLKMAQTLISFTVHLTTALFAFVESFFCVAEHCLHSENGVLDVLSSLGDVREFIALGVQLLRSFCATLAAPVDLVIFPLMDLNLAEAVHYLANSLVQLLMVIPRTTVERCALQTGGPYAVLMCTPDMAPFFNFFSAAVSSLGMAADNWLNIAFLIVQEAITHESPRCDVAGAGLIPDMILADAALFGPGARTAVVGLTDWLYAVTDGEKAVYAGYSEGPAGASKVKVQRWPHPGMDVSLGVAAVTYSSVHDLDVSDFSSGKTAGSMQTTGMLACNCTDDKALGMTVLCSILPMSGVPPEANPDDYLLQVLFPNALVAKQYTCQGVDLYVKSVRWSFTRYQTNDATLGSAQGDKKTLPTADCISRGACRELDATVWLVPRCGQDTNLNAGEGCTHTATCIPFCMAARAAGSGRDNLVLASAKRWRKGLTLLGRDCAMAGGSPATVGMAMDGAPVVSRAESGRTDLLPTGGVAVHGFQTEGPVECRPAQRMTSVVDKPMGVRVAANVGLSGQPFAITGDTLMTEVNLGGGAVSVQVERLEGNEVDVFSLNGLNQELPAHPRALVPLKEAELVDSEKLVVPYSYQTSRVAAVSSRNYVFYASNPPVDALGAYFQYCRDRTDRKKQIKMGLLLMSSYSPIRVYRVSAYRRCAEYSCGPGLVSFTALDGFSLNFSQACDEVFNVSVVALEYLNEENIGVMVQSSRVDAYNEDTGEFSGASTTRTVWWLNPTTMRVRRTVWQTSIPSASFATLCPSIQRLPRAGSFVSELVNSVVFLIRYVVFAILYTPGMVPVWRNGGICPQAGGAMYHSVLGNCGGKLFSLDDFFDSLDDAAAIFWHSLSLVGELITPTADTTKTAPMRDVLDGMSQYGQGSIDLWAAGASVLTLTRVPIKDQMSQLWATVQAGTSGQGVQGLSSGGAGIIAWSRYAYRAVSQISLDITRRALDPVAAEKLTAASVFKLISANLYDLQDEFDATVTSRVRMGCGGLRLIFGLGNPWSDLIYHQCMASAELTGDLMGLGLNIFVQIPMAKCVCKDSVGQEMASFVTKECAPSLPVSLLPTLFMIANGAQVCERILDSVKWNINKSMDSWFSNQYSALEALGSSVEYATASFDPGAGKCMDFKHDPHVVVIVPWPVDYFQQCSWTSRCKQICAAEWAHFQAAMAPPISPLQPFTVNTESMFFPGELDEDLQLLNVQAVAELPQNTGVCYTRLASAGPPDYVLAVAEVTWPSLRVEYWCAPRMPSLSVYRNADLGYSASQIPGTLLSLQFGDSTGEWLALLVQLEEAQAVVVVSRAGVFQAPDLEQALPQNSVLMRVANVWVIDGLILADLVTRSMQVDGGDMRTARSQSGLMHVFLRYPLTQDSAWMQTATNLMPFGDGKYWYTRLKTSGGDVSGVSEYLFLPKLAGLHLHHIKFSTSNSYIMQEMRELWPPTDLSSMTGAVLAPGSQSPEYVFGVHPEGWDWLKQVRWKTGGVAGVFASASVDVEVQVKGNCNERGCEGCTTVTAQRFCLAYNKCALINCVGTPVHQRRPLCGIGGLLQHSGGMALHSTQAAWTVFAEMLGLTLQLSLLSSNEAHLMWPEDSFLCYVCQAKDSSAEFFSILTATVNSALMLSEANIGYMYGGASNVDTNADAALTISSTALNAFMHQMALLPLYGMIASHQIMMCQVTGVLALMDATGFRLDLGPAGDASPSDIVAGQCLTVSAEVLANFPSDNPSGLGYTVMSVASNALQLALIQQIEPFLHFFDASLSYGIGVVHTLAVLVMSQNMAKCNPPDFYLKDIVRCACNDHRLQIREARRMESLADGALWCSGVLSMVDGDNQPYYVYNPYTYAQIQAMSAGLDNYTKCVSSGTSTDGYKCGVPSDPSGFLQAQGVNPVNVLVKCRDNFIKSRWDPAAYMLYQEKYDHLLKRVPTRAVRVLSPDPLGVRACLQKETAGGALAQECLQAFFGDNGILPEEYWAYERTNASILTGPEYTDACQTFTGPAEALNLSQFSSCVDGSTTGQACRLSGHIWTPLSENNVAVAEQHTVVSHGVNRYGLVQQLYKQASDLVLEAVEASLAMRADGKDKPPIELEFFSVEGDVLHQTMDCIFMGPYSRVDYWPIPPCAPGEECLAGPYWSRDDAGGGKSRLVDPQTCQAETRLPFTCGSPSRKSLMRYLVKEILPHGGAGVKNNNGTLADRVIRMALEDIRAAWNDTSTFGCPCAAGTGFSPLCCPENATEDLLPLSLQRPVTQIQSSHVLQAVTDDFGTLYNQALEEAHIWMMYTPSEELDQYRSWENSERVRSEARFHPGRPVSNYTSKSDALAPLVGADSSLWDVCHAALKQVFFTLPTKDETVQLPYDTQPFDGDPGKIQAYVQAILARAWEDSPLYRHYSPRHAPSPSQMCSQNTGSDSTNQENGRGNMAFTDLKQLGRVVLSGHTLPTDTPVFHAQRFRVGSIGACICGWSRQGGRCQIPDSQGTDLKVCTSGLVTCAFSNQTYSYLLADETMLWKAFSPSWFCPEFELSPHWGITDPEAAEDWLGRQQINLMTSSRDLYTHGRGGLRPGNVREMSALAKDYLNPTTREVPLNYGRLDHCSPPPAVEDLTQAWLDELFPVAQAVEEGGATAYCLRYTIELARLEIFRMLNGTDATEALVQQREVTAVWKRRCGSQLHLLHLCQSLKVYRPLLDTSRPGHRCPHFAHEEMRFPRVVYTTKQCLVSVDDVFYDPCRCISCSGEGDDRRINVTDLEARGEECKLRWDPRRILSDEPPSVGWFDGVHPLADDPVAGLIREDFTEGVLGDKDAVGNVPWDLSSSWWSLHGFLNETGEFCDGVLDWWNETWEFPVGYHVTVPCDASETAYRSFVQAFVWDNSSGALMYKHDMLRNQSLADSHSGVGGLCRSGSFGMPMYETNNMRYCTRIPMDDTADFTLPTDDREGYAGEWTEPKCTSSSRDLPWPDIAQQPGLYQSARFSVGTVPNMPDEFSAHYPASEDDMFFIGPWRDVQSAGDSWGTGPQACKDFDLLTCPDQHTCPLGYNCVGKVCTDDRSQACSNNTECPGDGNRCAGVCMDARVECLRHEQCANGMMCSGMGMCVQPVLSVQNRLARSDESISFSLSTNGSCVGGAREYSLQGGSYWGNTGNDLLKVHGMCSFEDWFKYTQTYRQPGCSSKNQDGSLDLDPSKCLIANLELPVINQSRWWPPGSQRPEIMYLRPSDCDRDYERLEGFSQCAPGQGQATLIYQTNARKATEYDSFVRLHTENHHILLADMVEADNVSFGFLGLNGAIGSRSQLGSGENPFVQCSTVSQCYPAPFTVKGVLSNRSFWDESTRIWMPYADQTPFICGAFGLEDPQNQGCKLDLTVLPLYRFLCRGWDGAGTLQSCRKLIPSKINSLCSNIQYEYQANNQDRSSVLASLRELFYAFPAFQSIDEYLDVTTCATNIFAKINDPQPNYPGGKAPSGLYFPMMFSLYEVPFEWFFQCVFLGGVRIDGNSRKKQDCRAFKEKRQITPYTPISPEGDPYETYLQHVRGGYTRAGYDAYIQNTRQESKAAVGLAKSRIKERMYGGGEDKSYPQCSNNMLWKMGEYGGPTPTFPIIPSLRALIWNFYDDKQSCKTNWQTQMIDDLKGNFGFDAYTWVDALTYPDPVNLSPQEGIPAETVLDSVESFLLSSMTPTTLQSVTSATGGAVGFNNIPPPQFDFASNPIDPGLRPKPSSNRGITTIDNSVSRTCVFPPLYDPKFSDIPAEDRETGCLQMNTSDEASGRRDTLISCRGKTCSDVPVLYSRNGRFNCRFVAAGGVIADGCTEKNPSCYMEVVQAVYREVVDVYLSTLTQAPILTPEIFPWFSEEGKAWPSFSSFDLSAQLDYANNIQPNPDRAVMCKITRLNDIIKFNECNNPHYKRLQTHVNTHYRHDGAVVVPPEAQLEWPIHRQLLEQGIVLSYSNLNRSLGKRYMDKLFDDNSVCKTANAQQVCWRKAVGKFVSMNPWMLGNFNPYAVCDVDFTSSGEGGREYVYSSCSDDNQYCSSFNGLPIPNQCKQSHKSWVQMQGVTRSVNGAPLDYNLCFHRLEEDAEGCLHDQGMLGGLDGQPVGTLLSAGKDSPKNLYETSAPQMPPERSKGLFAGLAGSTNPLWRGGEASYGHLQISKFDIGGHRIELEVYRKNETTDIFSVLEIVRLPLDTSRDGKYSQGAAGASRTVAEWVPSIAAIMQAEDDAIDHLYPVTYGTDTLAASCPLQRWIFYSGDYKRFAPVIPSAQRSSHLFHRIHGGLKSHPTVTRASEAAFLGSYRTSNGFCACPKLKDVDQPQCLISTLDQGTSPCSLDKTVESLAGGVELESYVFVPMDHTRAARKCTIQLDWPNVDATLRDNTQTTAAWDQASSPSHRECHVLDRFRPFKYKYQSVPTLKPLGKNTIQEGVCQTKRVVSWTDPAWSKGGARCLRSAMTSKEATFTCNTEQVKPGPKTMPRREPLTLEETLASQSRRKQKCSKCSPPPGFVSESGKPIPAESSFGVLTRPASVEARLANDLLKALCPDPKSKCPGLNLSAWTKGNFMRNYMLHPERLFTGARQPQAPIPRRPRADDASRWQGKPWLYCPSAESLSSGEGCAGTMTKEQWQRSRTSLCPRLIHSLSASNTSGGEPMAKAPFCVLDNTTDRVCQAVKEAQTLVRQANCMARGDVSCMPQPFVYHPASYEPSNNAWVHDTVKAYYKRVDPGACPLVSQSDTSLLEFARKYQRACPANAIKLMEGVLMTVRLVVTDVALLLTSMLSMFFRTLGLLFTSGVDGLKRGIRANWMYIRSKGRSILSSVSDLLIDTMLNSGELGARMLGFLDNTCTKVNEAAKWFMGVWCDYIQKYMVQVLFGLRKAIGLIGAGFEMLQDFIDEIWKGVLPAAFVKKYANKDFQDAMAERYSRPTDHVDKVAAEKNVPKTAGGKSPKTGFGSAAAKNSKFLKTGAKILGGVSTALSVVAGVYELTNGILDAIEAEKLAKLWPVNGFTLFDFSDVVDALDDMEMFLQRDQSCYVYEIYQEAGEEYRLFPCINVRLSNLTSGGSTAGTTSLDATRCWASASPSLGQNSLFSCTASSTCCETSACTKFIVCGTCPTPQLEGTYQYGCNSLEEKCMCGVAKSSISSCASNRQCDKEAQCEMVSSLSGTRFGTIPCKLCPSQYVVMCLLPPSGMPAQCACMLNKDMSYDLCGDMAGTKTLVNNQKLCGYLPGQPSTAVRWEFDMEDLIILPCIQVATGICSTVFNTGKVGTISMVVAVGIRTSASARGRRLLFDGQAAPEPGQFVHQVYESEYELEDSQALHALLHDPGWNTTSAPCSSLALAYQDGVRLGVLETFTLHKCAYWRYAGRRVIQRYNLSHAMRAHETFLLSMDDLVYAMMSPGVARALLSQPSVIGAAMLYHPWFKPLRALGVMVANQWEHIQWLSDLELDVREALTADQLTAQGGGQSLPRADNTVIPKQPVRSSRRLLSLQDAIGSVAAFSGQVIKGDTRASLGSVPSQVAGAWSTTAFVWPPRYDYSLEACPLAVTTLRIGRQVMVVNKLYFQNFNKPGPVVDRSFRAHLPSWDWVGEIKALPVMAAGKARSWASATFHWVLDVLAIPPSHMVAFFTMDRVWSLLWIFDTAIHCDLVSTLTCARHTKDLMMSTVVFVLLFLLIRGVTGTLGMGFLSILFLLSYPWFILWYTFGMAPTCFPMIPTCLLSDIVATLGELLPQVIVFPENLLCRPEEIGTPLNQTCLKSCDALGFESWVDPFAFAVCDTDPRTCSYLGALGDTGVGPWDALVWSPVRSALLRFGHTIRAGEALAGHRLCTWVTFVTATPILALLVAVTVVGRAVISAVLDLIPSIVAFAGQAYIFHRS